MSKQRISLKYFFSNILNAVGAGVVIALLPNALLGEFLKLFMDNHPLLQLVFHLVIIIQSFMAFIIGVLAAHQFKFNGSGSCMIGVAAMLGSGAVQFTSQGIALKGIGDIINIILVVIIACALYMLLQGKLGSLEMIILPVLIPVASGLIGLLTLPYVQTITNGLGHMVNSFTALNPLIMSILISVTFSLLMVTPISLVAIATAISLTGLGSGAANMGIVAACVTFIFGSIRVNSMGVNIVLLIGAAKMMIPVYLKHLIIAVPLTLNGIVSGVLAYAIGIKGTPLSAGFGYTGLVGPINAFNRMPGDATMNIILLIFGYLVIPFVSAFIIHEICKKLIPSYHDGIYKFEIPKQ
ncbi:MULTISPECIES: PTS transporter subunit IIC [unclassified Staphylococcus]|uniref:PTS transporter subunit IIC n=1 Tax=unclassified Staphylococcus TaxID=91994 RepID=UPI00187EE69A|nr:MULTISPECIES: PTS transporter subunit IIC [unclassified Staphylococcus]MBF2757785.1 PTS transporter subunit IIC [Staphylococcus haemolyticus]MBF2774501.1 PTS transporter subunit IIC [Staphylococcus haemolyticus]MBF2776982.1 PTS transporter subunit IIC [Staphylococcus haemolyticus]MBF2816450.1 PTS transporter subunit IIC [Staphylococcus haemolyticus]MBF9721505.1 PTS transporter subunit IIC [Staphylococcus haemolyticus]